MVAAMPTRTIEIPDCLYGPYQHWWEVGPYQAGLVFGGLFLIIGVVCIVLQVLQGRQKK